MDFDDSFRAALRELLVWRRDVRRFRTDPLPDGVLERLIGLACLAATVAYSVSPRESLKAVSAGDRIHADVVVAEGGSHLENIQVTQRGK